jgi:hypothetical protein
MARVVPQLDGRHHVLLIAGFWPENQFRPKFVVPDAQFLR